MRCIGRQRLQRLSHHLGDFIVSDLARRAAARLVIKTIETPVGEPLSPESGRQPGDAEFIRNRAIVHAVSGQQHDLGSHCIRPSNLSATNAHFQLATLAICKYDRHRWAACHSHLRIKKMATGNHGPIDVTRKF